MLNFRISSIVTCLILACLVYAHFRFGISQSWVAVLILIYLGLLVYGSSSISSGFFMRVICKAAAGSSKQLALTFDDGPNQDHTPRILDALDEAGIQAAFFCIGKEVEKNEEICRRMHREGHLIGNHSFSHGFGFDLLPAKKIEADLLRMDLALKKATGLKPRLFRPPYGVTTPALQKAVKAGGYIAVGWNIRSLDTMASNPDHLLEKIMRSVVPGSILLMHDTMKITADLLPALIRRLRAEGYEIVRLDKMLNLEPYA